MKIVIDARESGTSTGRYTDELIKNLYALHNEHAIVLITKPHRVSFYESIAANYQVIPTEYKEFSLGEQLGFKRQVTQLKPDLVHFGMVQQPVFYKGKTVTTMMDLTTIRFRNPAKNFLIYTFKQQIYKWVNKRVARTSGRIIAISEFAKQDIAAYTHVSPDKITVTYPAAEPIGAPAEPYQAMAGKQFIMYVGRPQPHKNLKRLVDAFALIAAAKPDLHLVLAGKTDANYVQLRNYVIKKGVKGVTFTDFISDAQLRWLYENAQAYVFPSLSEGFGLPGLEAMVHGCPVVSSNATCLPEVYGDAAHYFDPVDVQDMAAKITEVLDDPKLRKQLVDKGYKQAAKYSWRRMAEQTLAVYNDVLGK